MKGMAGDINVLSLWIQSISNKLTHHKRHQLPFPHFEQLAAEGMPLAYSLWHCHWSTERISQCFRRSSPLQIIKEYQMEGFTEIREDPDCGHTWSGASRTSSDSDCTESFCCTRKWALAPDPIPGLTTMYEKKEIGSPCGGSTCVAYPSEGCMN